jgi:L-alanine-DL-glutamate epimerase-like enolase superfamily enzyme
MKITEIETIALRDAQNGYDETVVRVHTDDGLTGIGQAESPSLVVDAVIRNSSGLARLLTGEDPREVSRLWQKMYNATGLYGRRGVTIAAIGAVETALWDIAGKAIGQPVHRLAWRPFTTTNVKAEARTAVTPYATVYSPGDSIGVMQDRLAKAVSRGYRAVKVEEWPGMFGNVDVATDRKVIRAAREAIGEDRDLLIDVQNKWTEYGQALSSIRAIEEFRPYFVEAPLPADNLEGYARLADTVDTRIAVGDWGFTTRHDFRDVMDRGRVDVVQPSSVRSGGISEVLHIAEMAYQRGLICVPHAWCHMVGVAAELHLAAVAPNMPYFETPIAYPPSPLVSELLEPAIEVRKDGTIEVPMRPGLGFALNEEVVRRYRVEPY